MRSKKFGAKFKEKRKNALYAFYLDNKRYLLQVAWLSTWS